MPLILAIVFIYPVYARTITSYVVFCCNAALRTTRGRMCVCMSVDVSQEQTTSCMHTWHPPAGRQRERAHRVRLSGAHPAYSLFLASCAFSRFKRATLSLSLSLSLYRGLNMYIYLYMYLYIYKYIYIYRRAN